MSVRPTSRQYLRCIPPHGISPHGRLNADRKSANRTRCVRRPADRHNFGLKTEDAYKRIRIAENYSRRMDSLRGYHPESPQCGQRVSGPLHRNSESEDSGQSAASRIPALVLPFIRGRYRKKRTDEGRSESGRWQPPIGKSKPGFGIIALRSASGKTGSTTLPRKLINH